MLDLRMLLNNGNPISGAGGPHPLPHPRCGTVHTEYSTSARIPTLVRVLCAANNTRYTLRTNHCSLHAAHHGLHTTHYSLITTHLPLPTTYYHRLLLTNHYTMLPGTIPRWTVNTEVNVSLPTNELEMLQASGTRLEGK